MSLIYPEAQDGAALPHARAGQYLTLRVTVVGEPATVRSRSLSSAPGAARYRLSVKREPYGIVSGHLHASPPPGSVPESAAQRAQRVFAEEAHGLPASLTNAREEVFARSGCAGPDGTVPSSTWPTRATSRPACRAVRVSVTSA